MKFYLRKGALSRFILGMGAEKGRPSVLVRGLRRDDPRREHVRSRERDATYPRRVYPALSSSPSACAGAILLAHLVRETPPRAA